MRNNDLVYRVRQATRQTQEDFARQLGCGSSTVRYWEINRMLPNSTKLRAALKRIARANDVPFDESEVPV